MTRTVNGHSARAVAPLCERANQIMARYFPPRPVAHGFHDPAGFIAGCRRAAAQARIRRALIGALVDQEIAAGRLALDGNLIVVPVTEADLPY